MAEVSGTQGGRVGHTLIDPGAHPRTCTRSFSAVIPSVWRFERVKDSIHFQTANSEHCVTDGESGREIPCWEGWKRSAPLGRA